MATAREIVNAAYRKLGILSIGREMTAAQASMGISEMNRMMHGWRLLGADTGHTDLALDDTFPLEPEFEEGTVYQLAQRLGSNFQVSAMDADYFFRALRARYFTIAPATLDAALLRPPSREEDRGIDGAS